MEQVTKELEDHLGQLLKQNRAGVVAALVAAAHRTGACHEALGKALSARLQDGQHSSKVPRLDTRQRATAIYNHSTSTLNPECYTNGPLAKFCI